MTDQKTVEDQGAGAVNCGERQLSVSGSSILAGMTWIALTRPVACLWPLEQPVSSVSKVAKSVVFGSLFKTMSEDVDLEYALIDEKLCKFIRRRLAQKGG